LTRCGSWTDCGSGNTKVDLLWKHAYEKEVEVRYSRSYGPGRYDASYEWGGADYPISYVRWTEQRNFDACLHLMKTGALKLAAITTRRVPFGSRWKCIGPCLRRELRMLESCSSTEPRTRIKTRRPVLLRRFGRRRSIRVGNRKTRAAATHLDVIGAGNFARTMLLQHLQGKIPFGMVVNATALSANHVKTKFGFDAAATDPGEALASQQKAPGAVLIATRHHLHAPLVKAALAAGRQVFVEKPLCLTRRELAEIDQAMQNSKGSVVVGFNRRFAPASVELKKHLAMAPGPKAASFRVMAGKLDPSHWYANYAESGGRVLGEACHFLDYFCFLFAAAPVRVLAQTTWPAGGRLPFPDSVTAQVEFADGSSGQLIYSAEGDPGYPKEKLTVFGAGVVGEITNFQELALHRGRKQKTSSYSSKGHAEEMAAWAAFLRGESEHPLPYAESRVSMLLTFAVLDSIQQARAVEV